MFQLQVQVLLVLVSWVLLLKASTTPHTDGFSADLIHDKEPTRLLLVEMLSKLMASRGAETLPELEEQLGFREEQMRRHIALSQRERKAGCRNFFWKTFTSC